MICRTCRSNQAARTQGRIIDGKYFEVCDICSNTPSIWLPDVSMAYPKEYRKGHMIYDPNLCDKTGKVIPFSSKREKAVIMNQLGLRQATSSERNHGVRNEAYLHRKKYFF